VGSSVVREASPAYGVDGVHMLWPEDTERGCRPVIWSSFDTAPGLSVVLSARRFPRPAAHKCRRARPADPPGAAS
jgi:hypothetical protein